MDASASAQKRTTQGPHSPSSTNKGAKHRTPVERVFHVQSMTTIHDSGVSNNENSNPNIISAPSIDSGTAHSSVTCGTAAKHVRKSGSGISSLGAVNLPARVVPDTPMSSTAPRPLTPSPHSTRQVDLLRRFLEENVLSPSQRRLNRLNLAQLNTQSSRNWPVATKDRILQSSSKFQLPASAVTPQQEQSAEFMQYRRYLEALNKDADGEVIRPLHFYQGKTQMHSRLLDTSESSMIKESRRAVSVTVPDIDELHIAKPSWYTEKTSTSHATMSEDAAVNTSSTVEKLGNPASLAGVKNLMQSFDEVDGDNTGDVPPQTHGLTDNEDSDDDGPSHIGEYLSDDEGERVEDSPDLWAGYMNLGKPDRVCAKCKAQMWNEERNNKSSKNSTPTFSICCKDGQVQLPPERPPPAYLASLLHGGEKSEHFRLNIRAYNSIFQFTSLGGKIDRRLNNGGGPYCFKLCGQNYHMIGSLKPKDDETPKFCQLYVYDTDNEVQNRLNAVPGSDVLDPGICYYIL